LFVLDARWTAGRANDHHIGDGDRRFLLRDSALDVALRIGTDVLLHHHYVLDQQLGLIRKHAQNAALLALVAPGHHFHRIVALDINSYVHVLNLCHPYSTSGARDTIFKNFFSRNSRATGPNTRVPTGSPASLMSTAAFWSKRIYVPSRRRCSFRVRTITALTTFPFCTCPSGAASFTLAVTTSPRPARSPVEPPSGRIICSLRAPELSATSSMLLIITAIVLIPPCASRPYCPVCAPMVVSGTSAVLRMISFRRHRLSFESGRVSSRRTT